MEYRLAGVCACRAAGARLHARRGGRGHECDTLCLPFYFRVESCAEPGGMIASFTFGKATDADPVLDELFSLTGPKNVGLEIASDDTKTTLRPGVPFLVNAVGTGRSYQFNARLRETQPTVRGGEFRRPLLVQVEFF